MRHFEHPDVGKRQNFHILRKLLSKREFEGEFKPDLILVLQVYLNLTLHEAEIDVNC